jgi:hypothetical protein
MMKSVFDLAKPRPEVLQGQLSEDMFAARLRDVMDNRADPAYRDADRFFASTYPTDGLRTLLVEVLGRLTGQSPTNTSIIRLETSFGGGKSHNLIALYHAVSGKCNSQSLVTFIGKDVQLPKAGTVDVAGIVGSDLDPTTGIYHAEDNLTTHTLWGELAWQLGGRAGYALAQQSDQNRSAPGTALLERLIGERPTLIMIDEIARHLRAAIAEPTATGKSTLAEQTVAFLMSLLEFVASRKQVVVVLTMASDADAFRNESDELREALSEALKVTARQERVLTPTGENEIAAIVVHRLFQQVDKDAAQPTIQRYGAYYHMLDSQGAHIHERALRADYLHEFQLAYPFHPELIRVLSLRVATIPNFQRTRGALRLLALVVRELWQKCPANTWLIHTHHVDLSQDTIVNDLSSRLDRTKFRDISKADIVSPQIGIPAHATEADEPQVASGKPPYARYAATTIFLHSLTQGVSSGVELPDLLLATLAPIQDGGDDPALFKRALDRLYEKAWYLEYDGYRYRFKTEPSLNKIVDEETTAVGPMRAKQELDSRIRTIWKAGYLKPEYFPDAPHRVDDDADKPKLAIMHYDAVKVRADADAPPELVRKIYERAGLSEGFRNYQNNVVFLVADADQVDTMIQVTRRYLAISRITDSTDRMREFSQEYQKQLRKMGQSAELNVRIAITKAYRYLFYPLADAPQEYAHLRRETVPPQEQGETNTDQTNVVVKFLHDLGKVKRSDDTVLAPQYVKSRAWDRNQVEMTTEDLRRAFARRIGLSILLDTNLLRKTIEYGVNGGIWLYYEGAEDFAYDKDSPRPVWQISQDARLYTPEEAQRLKLRIKGKWQATVSPTGNDIPEVGDDDEPPADDIVEIIGTGRPSRLQGHGVPAQAFQQIWDQCSEHKATTLRRIQLAFDGMGSETVSNLNAIGLAIPQMGKATFGIELKLNVAFGGQNNRHLRIDFRGDWEQYKRLKQTSDGFARDAGNESNIEFRLVIEFESPVTLGNAQLETIQQVLVQMNMGPIQVTAEPVYL